MGLKMKLANSQLIMLQILKQKEEQRKLSFLKSVNGDGTEDNVWCMQNWGCNSDAEYVTCMYESKTISGILFYDKVQLLHFNGLNRVSVLYPKLSFLP